MKVNRGRFWVELHTGKIINGFYHNNKELEGYEIFTLYKHDYDSDVDELPEYIEEYWIKKDQIVVVWVGS